MKTLISAVLCAVAGVAISQETTWNGGSGVVDWSSGLWSDGVPTSDGVAKFAPVTSDVYFKVTPPTDFAGIVEVADAGDEPCLHSAMVEFENASEGDWKVRGSGTVVAVDGLAARLSDGFVGVIEIPRGSAFTAPTNLNAAVEFVGDGRLTVSSVEQLSHVGGFSGELSRTGEAVTAAFSDPIDFQGKTFVAAQGETFSFATEDLVKGGAIKFLPTLGTAAWQLNYLKWNEVFLSQTPTPAPAFLSNDEVLLTDAPGRTGTMFFKNRRFTLMDDWGVSFTWTPSEPKLVPSGVAERGQRLGGSFGVIMQSLTPENVKLDALCGVDAGYGLVINCDQSSSKKNLGIVWMENGVAKADCNLNSAYLNGIDIADGKPVEVVVSCRAGVMTCTLSQNGHSRTVRHSFAEWLGANGKGAYVGLMGVSTSMQSNTFCPWAIHRVSNFCGWYRAFDEAPWSPIDNLTYPSSGQGENSYSNFTVYLEGDHMVTNWNAAAYDGEGNIRLQHPIQPTGEQSRPRGAAVALNSVPSIGRYMVTYDLSCATRSAKLYGRMMFGLCADPSYIGENAATDMFGPARIGSSAPNKAAVGVYFAQYEQDGSSTYFYVPTGTKMPSSAGAAAKGVIENCNLKCRFYYDSYASWSRVNTVCSPADGTEGGYAFQRSVENTRIYNPTDSKSEQVAKAGRNLYPLLHAFSDNSFVDQRLTGVSVCELSDNVSPAFASRVVLDSGVTAQLRAGATHVASTSPALSVGVVALAGGATLRTVAENSAARISVGRVSASGEVFVSADSGATTQIGDRIEFKTVDSKLTLQGSVAFGDSLTLVVPGLREKGWARGPIALVDASAALIVGEWPSMIRVVTESGEDVTSKVKPQIEDNRLQVTVRGGLVLMVR